LFEKAVPETRRKNKSRIDKRMPNLLKQKKSAAALGEQLQRMIENY
jgi:hypothetical protein